MDSLIPEFQKDCIFVLADLNTPEGHAFAIRHNVPNTVLIFFDGDGRKLDTIYGVQEPDELQGKIKRILGLKL